MTYLGVVSYYNRSKGYGFIECVGTVNGESKSIHFDSDDSNVGKKFFVHISNVNILSVVYKKLLFGEAIYFDVETDDGTGKSKCVNVRGLNGRQLICEQIKSPNAPPE